jgi:transposase
VPAGTVRWWRREAGRSGPPTRPRSHATRSASCDRMLNEGKDVADVCRELQVSKQTYYRWRNQLAG